MSEQLLAAAGREMAGFFGKVPARGDFVRRALPAAFVTPWDEWLQAGIAGSKEVLGDAWLEVYLTSPVWRFALSAQLAGEPAAAGVLIPSVDAVGRYFPLTLACLLPDDAAPAEIRSRTSWFDDAERLAVTVLEEDATLDDLVAGVDALGAPVLEPQLPPDAEGVHLDDHDARAVPPARPGSTAAWAVLDPRLEAGAAMPAAGVAPALAAALRRAAGWRLGDSRLDGGRAMTSRQAHLVSASRSHVGHVRDLNEDSCLARPDLGIWAVADGMGGHDGGDYASALIVRELGRVRRPASARELMQDVDQALAHCNRVLVERARGGELSGSTIVALLVFDANFAAIWAGDSRLYRLGVAAWSSSPATTPMFRIWSTAAS